MKRKRNIVTICVLVVLAILGFFINRYKFDNLIIKDYNDMRQSGVLHIATSFDPIGYFVSDDSIAGFNHDLLNALQQYSDIKFEISVENSLDKSLEKLKSGKYDLIARNIPINSDLKNQYCFTEPIVYNKLVLVQRKTEYNKGVEAIRNHLQLGGKTIHTPKDSPSIFRIRNLSHEIGDSIYIIQDSVYEASQLAMMVAAGDIDYTVCDIKTAETLASKFPELDIKTDIGFTHLEAWAVRANSPILLDSLNTWINRFKQTKEYIKIQKKYYNK
jgi:membrane-bound lytic murein transglycosylase F